MKNTSALEIILIGVVAILGFVLLNPFNVFMPSMLEMTLYGLLLIAAAIFAGFVASEKVYDEREEKHRATAGRIGYLLGLCVLIIGILTQTLSHRIVDQWLTSALLVMVIGKICARVYMRMEE